MSDWSRLYDACFDATGDEIENCYDAHLVVEKLTNERDLLKRKLNKYENTFDCTEKQINSIFTVVKYIINSKCDLDNINLNRTRLVQMLKDEFECELYSKQTK